MAAIRVQEYRLAFVVHETSSALPDENGSGGLLLGNVTAYARQYEAAKAAANGLHLPWGNGRGRSFWTYYLETVTVRQAWRKLAPLRLPLPPVAAPGFPGTVALTGYLYPFGQTLVATHTVRAAPPDGMTLDQVVASVIAARRDQEYRFADGREPAAVALDGLLARGLDLLRTRNGSAGPAEAAPADPFSVLTVIRGTGVAASDRVPDPSVDVKLQRVLWGMCSGSRTYQRDTLELFAQMAIKIRKMAPPEHVLYGSKRGRAVWFPQLFLGPWEGKWHPLGVYHRNIVACSAQVESLGGLIRSIARRVDQGRVPPFGVTMKELARNAGGALGRLRGGGETYRTRSALAQIDQWDGLPAWLQVVRDECEGHPE